MKDIPGFEGRYAITRDGKVWSYPKSKGKGAHHSGKFLKPAIPKTKRTYPALCLGGTKLYTIHRLVAEAYIPNPENKRCVNHKNGNKLDNRVENLEWCTDAENRIHAKQNKLFAYGEKNGASKLAVEDVVRIRNLYSQGVSVTEIHRQFKCGYYAVYAAAKGVTWKHVM